jgi:hypothetical protein
LNPQLPCPAVPVLPRSAAASREQTKTDLVEVEMKDFSLSDVRLFTKAAQLGGLTPAADVLNVPKASASRQLQRLEATVGHQLLHRGSTRFALTEEGREFLVAAQHVLTILDDVMLNLSSSGTAVTGRLRIAVPHYYGSELLMSHLPRSWAPTRSSTWWSRPARTASTCSATRPTWPSAAAAKAATSWWRAT